MRPVDYWASGAGLGNITPAGKAWPEGEGFADWLHAQMYCDSVVEFGCGPGRLAGCFKPHLYVGVDVCRAAIEAAQAAHPAHQFLTLQPGHWPPRGDVLLAHTVLLHIPDDDLPATLARFTQPRVVVSEILGRHWRRDGNPPVFNRGLDDYVAAFSAAGYDLVEVTDLPYPHYGATPLAWMEFRRRDRA